MHLFNFRPRLRWIVGKRVPRRLLVLRKAWWLQNEGSRREEQDSNDVYRTHLSYWPRRSPTGTSRHLHWLVTLSESAQFRSLGLA